MSKRIVLFFDGSWSNFRSQSQPGNVSRLMSMMASCDETQAAEQSIQLSYFDDANANSLSLKNLSGAGLYQSLERCYRYLATHYSQGDQIYCFGASRGAYHARHLCGMLDQVGLLPVDGLYRFKRVYRLYRAQLHRSLTISEAQNLHRYTCDAEFPEMRFLGVWDTVGGEGIPLPGIMEISAFFGSGLGKQHGVPGVQIARQALALDERRSTLTPSPWVNNGRLFNCFQDISQQWFAGSHADVCGTGDGYLGDRSLLWMAGEAEQAGVTLRDGSLQALRDRIIGLERESEAMNIIRGHSPQVTNEYSGFYRQLERLGLNPIARSVGWRQRSDISREPIIEETIHSSVDDLFRLKHGFYRPGNLLNALAGSQVEYAQGYAEQYGSCWYRESERRNNGRKPCLEMVEVDRDEAHYDCQVFDRSDSGVGIRFNGVLRQGEVVNLKEYTERRRAHVMWVHDDRAGLAFAA